MSFKRSLVLHLEPAPECCHLGRQRSKPHVSKLPTTHAAAPQIKLTTQDIPKDCSGKLLEPHCYLVSRTIQNSISEETHAAKASSLTHVI